MSSTYLDSKSAEKVRGKLIAQQGASIGASE